MGVMGDIDVQEMQYFIGHVCSLQKGSSRHTEKDSVFSMCGEVLPTLYLWLCLASFASAHHPPTTLARPVIVALFQIACKIPDRVDL